MNRPTDETLLAFLEGRLGAKAREALMAQLAHDEALRRELQSAAAGLAALEPLGAIPPALPGDTPPAERNGVSPWWVAVAAAASLAIAVPGTLWISGDPPVPAGGAPLPALTEAPQPEPGFVLVLHGRWPDAETVAADERIRRATEYWAWTDSLAGAATLMAAGDLRWEPGTRLGPNGTDMAVADASVESPDFLVGMFAIRAESYDQAMAIARACPHLRYGGSVSVRRAARGVVTTAIALADPTPR